MAVSKSSARSAPSPPAAETPSDAGRMKMKKNSIIGILQLSERMTRTTSQSTTRRGGSAEPHRNRASAADRKAGSGCRHEAIVNSPKTTRMAPGTKVAAICRYGDGSKEMGNDPGPETGTGRDRIASFIIVRAWILDRITRMKSSQKINRSGLRAAVLIRFRRMCASR